jgi:glycosyltransferase involved in cell wall biosynthesis
MPLFENVTLLITHYNRSASLERLLRAFQRMNTHFGAIVVSDDASTPEHLERLHSIQKELPFQLLTAAQNGGLGNNINKGQDAVQTPYTLYVQEDFEPSDIFSGNFETALKFMDQDPGWDIVRFYAYFPYPNLRPRGQGYSEMIFRGTDMNHLKFYFYSDHPHLRRSNFFEKFGRYPEGIKGDHTEFTMALSFLHHKARGLFFDKFDTLFFQKNSTEEPSTMNRAGWRESNNAFIQVVRWVYLRYRWLKNSSELYFFKPVSKPSAS